jgi:hypothetical protein
MVCKESRGDRADPCKYNERKSAHIAPILWGFSGFSEVIQGRLFIKASVLMAFLVPQTFGMNQWEILIGLGQD